MTTDFLLNRSILVVDDEESFRRIVIDHLSDLSYSVSSASNAEEALVICKKSAFDLVLLDVHMAKMTGLELLPLLKAQIPAPEVVIITAHSDVTDAVRAIKNGAYDYLTKPVRLSELEAVVERSLERGSLMHSKKARIELKNRQSSSSIIGESLVIQNLHNEISRAAKSDLPVLIQGETGTGKDLVAQAIHNQSDRSGNSFVPINCGGLTSELIGNEIFGHERGAYTGATGTKRGLLELADRGVAFFDEIADLPLDTQAHLLRVIEEKKFRRVGGTKEIRSDFRLVSATCRNLQEQVGEDRFREDLFFRVSVIQIEVPPLRERKEDVKELAVHFAAGRVEFDHSAISALEAYQWPGNVRELKSVVERAWLEDEQIISSQILEPLLAKGKPIEKCQKNDTSPQLPDCLEDAELQHVLRVLCDAGNVKSEAARLLKISRTRLDRILSRK